MCVIWYNKSDIHRIGPFHILQFMLNSGLASPQEYSHTKILSIDLDLSYTLRFILSHNAFVLSSGQLHPTVSPGVSHSLLRGHNWVHFAHRQ